MVMVPTVAATDSPTSSLTVVYSDDGEMEEVRFYERSPDSVVVDSEIIARAPARFLVAGMGDGLATYFEAVTAVRTGHRTIAGGVPTEMAVAVCRLCYDIIMRHGLAARAAVERDAVTPAVEKVIEANTLLSGLGFESGGTSAAHAFHNGITLLPESHHLLHGEKVAFGVVCQLMLEGYSDEEVERVVDFCLSVGLPTTFEDLGMERVSREDLARVARRAAAPGEDIHKEPFEVRPELLLDAMLAADAFGRWRAGLYGRGASTAAR
jgi:glycerol dehydrogenase